jgi:alpha-L-arabinofuranosidase
MNTLLIGSTSGRRKLSESTHTPINFRQALASLLSHLRFGGVFVLAIATAGCHHAGAQRNAATEGNGSSVTNIAIDGTIAQSDIKRLGINITTQSYYDSGQVLRNLVFRNPGFEGEIWQTILRCKAVTATSCTDWNQWGQWPANFLEGGQFEFISGPAVGQSGTVTMSLPAQSQIQDQGTTIGFAPLAKVPAANDFVIVKKSIPGNAETSWFLNASGGGVFDTEFSDLSPQTQGKQALRVSAEGSGRWADVSSIFDSMANRSFVRLNGPYRLSFRAKGVGGENQLRVSLVRQTKHETKFFEKGFKLSNKWADYSYDFNAAENGVEPGSVILKFSIANSSILLDDVSLASTTADNPTPFRDEVVSTLKDLHPGILRYWDSETSGSTIDNLIAPALARQRAGSSSRSATAEDAAIGLHEFLQLCEAVDAEPYFDMPAAMSPEEAKNLIEYFAGAPSTPYGAKRAARGQTAPWTTVFPVIHLELGNEQWNGPVFPGLTITDGVVYGKRAKDIFAAAKSSPSYQAAKFDLVLGAQAVNTWLTGQELANSDNYDSISFAPYLFSEFNDASSNEAIFGPMFAQPEMIDSVPAGYMAQQVKIAKEAKRPAKVVVYEVNLHTTNGSADQASFSSAVPSVGAGLALVDHMLLMMRDLGVKTQSVWAISGYANSVNGQKETPLFATVVDMGGATNLRRPQFIAEQLANRAILPTMLATKVSGSNPTWRQPKSANGDIQLEKAHYIQSFAFSDGAQRSVIVFNLNRTETLPITFSGVDSPNGSVQIGQLTSKNITDTNESQNNVRITDTNATLAPGKSYPLPPFSMTVIRWTVAH